MDRAATAGLDRRWGWLLGHEIWTKGIWTRLKKTKKMEKERGGRAAGESGSGDGVGARDEPRARDGRERAGESSGGGATGSAGSWAEGAEGFFEFRPFKLRAPGYEEDGIYGSAEEEGEEEEQGLSPSSSFLGGAAVDQISSDRPCPSVLSMTLFHNMLDRVRNRFNEWSASSLTMAGRATLLQSVLQSIPMYQMQGHSENQRRIHMVRWDTVTRPKEEAGLGLRCMSEFNCALLGKIGWGVVTRP
ncbi:hypothetical protein CRG98_014406 [Punica granatum]|uniref:Uncharacterized protein n=1 Tax=Punica granatum TaxID=22663 RepID=A0A2I0K9M7_PUNGR|nr:hypothetical protein CRG98_014406 [Punica granatum]